MTLQYRSRRVRIVCPAKALSRGLVAATALLACAVASPGSAVAGPHDETAWITNMLDGEGPAATRRQAALARSSKGETMSDAQPATRGRGEKQARRGKAGKQVASLGREPAEDLVARQPSLTGKIAWLAQAGCLAGQLASVVADVAANFGPVRVNSTCRSHRHNARVGGARRSYHLTGSAVDFRVFGNARSVAAYLRSHVLVGGLKHYGGGLFHVDTGARRRM